MYAGPHPSIPTTARPHIAPGHKNDYHVFNCFWSIDSRVGPRAEPGGQDKLSRRSRPPDPRHDLYLTGQSEGGGSGRVRSTGLKISRVRSGRVRRLSNLTGRVGSGQQLFKSRWSGRVGPRGFQSLAGRVGSKQHTSIFSRVGSG